MVDIETSGRLPTALSTFVGRVSELAELRELIRDHRLVSVVGPGGAGKTRLAAEAIRTLQQDRSVTTWWCELGNLVDPTLLPSLIARVVGISLGVAGDIEAEVVDLIAGMNGRVGILVLDNCEHIADSAATLTRDLLAATGSDVRVLVTSRRSLGVYGELCWQIPPLGLPTQSQGRTMDVSEIREFDATRLFLDRMTSVRRDLAIDGRAATAIADICVSLEGMPLAIEFAAARCRSLELTRIKAGLDDTLTLLRGRGSTWGRHDTMEASVAWSYSLLSEADRVVLRRLSVFVGGFTFDDAVQVVWSQTPPAAVTLDSLESLADHSLLQFSPNVPGSLRYRLQDVVRQFAAARLSDAGEQACFRDRHASHYLVRARAFSEIVESSWDGGIFAQLAGDLDNLIAAVQTMVEKKEYGSACLLFCATQHLWGALRPREASRLAESILVGGDGLSASDRALLHAALAVVWSDAGSLERAYIAAASALVDSDPRVAHRAKLMVVAFSSLSDPVGSEGPLRAEIQACTECGDRWAALLGNVWLAAIVLLGQGAGKRGEPAMQAALQSSRSTDPLLTAWALSLLGVAYADRGDAETALDHVGRARQVLQGLGELLPGGVGTLSTSVPAVVADLAEGLVQILRDHPPLPDVNLDRSAESAEASGHILGSCIYRLLGGLNLLRIREVNSALGELRLAQTPADLLGTWMGDRVRLATAWALLSLGDPDRARECIDLLVVADPANPIYRSQLRAIQADLELKFGHANSALDVVREELKVAVSDGFWWEALLLLEVMACGVATSGRRLRAVRIFAAARQHRLGRNLLFGPPCHIDLVNAATGELRKGMGESEFARAWSEGQRMTLVEAAGYADMGPLRRGRATSGLESITPAERRVMRFVGHGLTNAEIAQRLFVSPETVKTHMLHIFNKLDVRTRTEVAALAAQHGYLSETSD